MSDETELREQVTRLQAQLSDPRRRPLCESKGCPRSAIGYAEQNGVRWLVCDQHGGAVAEVARLRAELASVRQAIADYFDDVIDGKALRHA